MKTKYLVFAVVVSLSSGWSAFANTDSYLPTGGSACLAGYTKDAHGWCVYNTVSAPGAPSGYSTPTPTPKSH